MEKKGSSSHSGQSKGGNFKNDPKRASEAGKKGGEHSHGGQHSHGAEHTRGGTRPDSPCGL